MAVRLSGNNQRNNRPVRVRIEFGAGSEVGVIINLVHKERVAARNVREVSDARKRVRCTGVLDVAVIAIGCGKNATGKAGDNEHAQHNCGLVGQDEQRSPVLANLSLGRVSERLANAGNVKYGNSGKESSRDGKEANKSDGGRANGEGDESDDYSQQNRDDRSVALVKVGANKLREKAHREKQNRSDGNDSRIDD